MTRFITTFVLGLLLALGLSAQTRRVQPHNHTTATAGLSVSGGDLTVTGGGITTDAGGAFGQVTGFRFGDADSGFYESADDKVKYDVGVDSTDCLQFLDADGGVPIVNVNCTDERVGIGTATPAANLDVRSIVGDPGDDILVEDTVGNAVLRVKASSAGAAFLTIENTSNSWRLNTSANDIVLQDGTFAEQLKLTVAGNLKVIGGFISGDSANVASATATALGSGNLFHITGITTITSVTTCNAANNGREVSLIFDGILTFTDGSNLVLAGNFVTTANDTIKLVCDGTNWYEMSRSIN